MKSSEFSDHPFLRDIAPEHLEILAAFAMPVNFVAGETIFRQGETANRFYLIQSGRVELGMLTGEKPLIAQNIGAGDVLGWSWLTPSQQWNFDARAVEPTQAIFLYGTMLRARCEEDHDFGYALMCRFTTVMMKRLRAARERLLMLERANPSEC